MKKIDKTEGDTDQENLTDQSALPIYLLVVKLKGSNPFDNSSNTVNTILLPFIMFINWLHNNDY